jgi:excisionase family DNA binding protein
MDEQLLTTEQAAAYLNLKPTTLEQWRWERGDDGPPFLRLSRRAVRYRQSDLEAWAEKQIPGRFRNAVTAGGAA